MLSFHSLIENLRPCSPSSSLTATLLLPTTTDLYYLPLFTHQELFSIFSILTKRKKIKSRKTFQLFLIAVLRSPQIATSAKQPSARIHTTPDEQRPTPPKHQRTLANSFAVQRITGRPPFPLFPSTKNSDSSCPPSFQSNTP